MDLIRQKITTDISHQGRIIATFYFDLLEHSIHRNGSFEEIKHLQEFGIDEQYIISRIKEQLTIIVEANLSKPDVLNI